MIEARQSNVTVMSGQKAILTCTFSSDKQDLSLSSSHQLIWIRLSYGSHTDDTVLTHNEALLMDDPRFTVQRTDSEYTLTISNINADDEGIYACEVNTQPPQKASIQVSVHGKKTDLTSSAVATAPA